MIHSPFPDRKPGAEIDLYCLAYAGGSSAIYRDWDRLFPDWVAVRPVEYPGRGTRLGEPLLTDPGELAGRLAGELRSALSRPWAIFGHSLGAALAYEVALELGANRSPLGVFASGRHSPSRPDPSRRRSHLDDEALVEEVRALNGSPPEVLENRELLPLILPIIRADFRLSETVSEQPRHRPLGCDLHVFGATEDPEVPVEALEGWRDVAGAGFSRTVLPGDHFFLHHTPQFQTMRTCICSDLARLLAGSPSLGATV